MPGTSPSVFKSIDVILNPPSPGSSFTVAVVLTRLAGCPAFSRLNASAIEKQPASAAPMSSSGFVPLPLSKRDENEYGPSNAPLPSFMVPLPCFSVPSHTADPVRVAMVSSFDFDLFVYVSPRMQTSATRFPPNRASVQALGTSASTNSRRLPRRYRRTLRFDLSLFVRPLKRAVCGRAKCQVRTNNQLPVRQYN